MTRSSITRILLLDSDRSWCEPASIYISQRLENLRYPCQVIVAYDRAHALREIEHQVPHLVIVSERLKRRESVRDIEGLLFLEKIDLQCPTSLKILILDRQPDQREEIGNLVERYLINRTFFRSDASLNMLGFVDAVTQLLKTVNLFENGYALLVGVGDDLPVTVNDSMALYEVLSNPSLAAYPRDNIQLLTAQNANKANILDALDELSLQAQSNPESTISIYFSGHGCYLQETGDYFLILYGYNRNNYSTTLLSSRELANKIRTIPAKRLIVWLDCCHADGMLERVLESPFIQSPPTSEFISTLNLEGCRLIVTSSDKGQFSYIGDQYSIFISCLLDALKGKGRANRNSNDRYVRIFDVLSYLQEKVPERAYPRLQNPTFLTIDELSEDFPICYRSKLIIPNNIRNEQSLNRGILSPNAENQVALRAAIVDQLSQLPPPQFEELIYLLGALDLPRENLGGAEAAQRMRVIQMLEWVESPVGCGRERLMYVLRDVMGLQS